MGTDIRSFLEALENEGPMLGEGKEWAEIPQEFKDALKRAGVTNPKFAYKPDDYNLVVYQLKEEGSQPNSWGMAFMTEADFGEEEKDLFNSRVYAGNMLKEDDDETGMTVIGKPTTGTFLDVVQLAIEVASTDAYKKGFSPSLVKKAVTQASK